MTISPEQHHIYGIYPHHALGSLSSNEPPARGPTGTEPASAAEAQPTIVVADDDPLIVATLSRGLRDAGFIIVEAYDSASALEACLRNSPTVALIDYKMPGATGAELARSIAAQTTIPIVFLSGYSDESLVREAIDAGAMSYLVKPIDISQLLPVLRSAVERARDLRQLRSEIKIAQTRNRTIGIATGLLMLRFQITQKDAFERLRRHARSTRSRLEDVAAALLRATEENTVLYEKLAQPQPRTKDDESPKNGAA